MKWNLACIVSLATALFLSQPVLAEDFTGQSKGPHPAPVTKAEDGQLPPGYVLITSAGAGRAIFVQKADVKIVPDTLKAAVADLKKFFESPVTTSGAFVDAKTNHGGGAFFSAQVKGQTIKGSILCGISDKGAAITVIYNRADAPAAEWNTLLAAIPGQVKEFKFPDGTGSVELPQGWKTLNRSVVGGVRITGPALQVVTLGQGAEVLTPDSQLIALHDQLAMQARQMGGPPPPPIAMLVAPYTGPLEALKNLVPQISQFSQTNKGPAIRLDKIIETSDAEAAIPNGKAALIYYSSIQTEKGKETRYRSISQIETYMVGPGTWGVFFSELTAPDSSFDADILTMRQIAASFKVNDQAVQQVTQNIIAANNQRFAAFQQSMKEKNDAFERMNESWRNRELVQSRSNDDFDEVIRGYRTVEDTQTGEHASVDLGNVDRLVDKLNEHDPGRYKPIPLRDEMDPLPGAHP